MDAGLRARSGEVDSDNPIVGFLYDLMRDHLPCGVVEELVGRQSAGNKCRFTNGFLANYAKDLSERLVGLRGDRNGRCSTREGSGSPHNSEESAGEGE
ncbi:hypothetical protein LCGC14_2503190 [marine sediment metagenome]|uniref:Uncharacterized protein n=1 Tax=marine sediment metagenome TaxID=412755 RepID=A0A0F9DUY0_9ZZZZ